MPSIKQYLTTRNHTKGRGGKKIEYLVHHYTYGAQTAEGAAYANCSYFAKGDRGASAHYFTDDGEVIWQSVEDKNTAWSVGSHNGKYKHAKARNQNTLSLEVCTKGEFTKKEIENVRWWTLKKMKEHNIPAANVIRHYDVTGKLCPAYYVNAMRWKDLHKYITTPIPKPEVPVVPETPYWEQVAIFPTPQEALSFAKDCEKGLGVKVFVSGAFTQGHGNDGKSRAFEAEAEKRGATCPRGRARTDKESWKKWTVRTPYIP